MKTGYILFLAILTLTAAQAEDLTTREGKVFHDYKVLSHDAGYLTILYSEGGGKIPLSDLPDDLQKKYGYDKAQADAFIQSTIEQDRKDRAALTAERNLAAQKRAAAAAAASSVAPMDPQAPATGGGVAPAASASDVFTEQKSNNLSASGPPQAVAAAMPGVPASPAPMTEEKRQEAMDYAKARITEFKGDIRTDEILEAKQRAALLLSGQNNGQPVTAQTPVPGSVAERDHRKQLEIFRDKLRQLRASAPPIPKSTLTDEQIADMRTKVKKLNGDIRDKQRALDQESPGVWNPQTFDFPDEIEDEADQMKRLQTQLPPEPADADQAAGDALRSTPDQVPTGPLSPQDIEDIKLKIQALEDDIAFMKKEEARHTDPQTGQRISGTPHGAFADKIEEETKQVQALKDRITPKP